MGLFDNDNDASTIIGQVRAEQNGFRIEEHSTGGFSSIRDNPVGLNSYDRHDAIGNRTDHHDGFGPRW